MRVNGIKTEKVLPGDDLWALLDKHLSEVREKSVVAITSKVVGLCEGRVVPIGQVPKEDLVKREADYYIDPALSKYNMSFTITHGTLVPVAGIDESNGNGNYVLWPENPQESAAKIWRYLKKRFTLDSVGVVITDSTARPLHFGTEGVAIAYCGFAPSNDYIGKPDLFGRPFKISISNVLDALAAAAVVVMGEGTEQTPLALIEDVPFLKFQDKEPSPAELNNFFLKYIDDDLFGPFLKNAPWQKGGRD